MPGTNSETRGRFCDGLGNDVIIQHDIDPNINLLGRISMREYVGRLGNQVHPTIQTLFPNNDTVLQDGNAPIHTDGTVQPWFE
jgi:hypothetical protein